MKKAISFKLGDKEYFLMFNTRALAEMERLNHGRSIMLIMGSMLRNSAAAYNNLNLDFTLAGLKAGLQNMPKDTDYYDFIDRYCEESGSIDDLNGYILKALISSGLFTQGGQKEEEKMLHFLDLFLKK